MGAGLNAILKRLSRTLGFKSDWYLIGVGAVVGTLTGLGAVGFAEALHAFEKIVHALQTEGEAFGISMGPPELWIVLGPMIGMGLTGILVHYFAAEARGHGVPQVLLALIKKGGNIPARIGVVKVVASILTVGSGGSAGTEGPIVQIGATAGSAAGRVLRLDRVGMQTLVGCGAAAGISSIFNAPIAGVFFVLEILLRDFSVRIFTPIVVASVFSQVVTQFVLGENEAIFATENLLHDLQFRPEELPSYIGLGAACGLAAIGFNRLLHKGEDIYAKLPLHPLLKPLTGAVLLGLLGLAFIGLFDSQETPGFFGNGYETIRTLIETPTYEIGDSLGTSGSILVGLLLGKLFATTLTLASGGSGGVFAPSLFIGAVTGAVVGLGLERLGLMPQGSTPASYALVGMAAVVAASTHAPLTAILILFELTRNPYVVLPIMLSATIATVIAQLIERDSVYTYRLRRAGVLVGQARDVTILRRLTVAQVERTSLPAESVYASDPLGKLVSLHATHHVPDFAVVDQAGGYLGMVTGADMRTALIDREAIPLLLVAELVRADIPTVSLDETLDSVMDKFAKHDVASLCLVGYPIDGTSKPLALITRAAVMRRYQQALDVE